MVSDVYMCTSTRASSSRDPSPPLYIHLGSLNHLCTEPLSPAAAPAALYALGTRQSPVRSLLRGVRGHTDTAPLPASLLRSVQGERDAVKIQPSFLKRARSIVRSFSKGSRGIACPKPFISVSAEVRPSRLARRRERSAGRTLDKVSRRHNEEAAASGKLADVSISCPRRAQRTVTRA